MKSKKQRHNPDQEV